MAEVADKYPACLIGLRAVALHAGELPVHWTGDFVPAPICRLPNG